MRWFTALLIRNLIFSEFSIIILNLGCVIEINETGTSLKFKPGILLGGAIKEPHNCGVSRCIGWFIEGIIPLAIFSKSNLSITFSGLTNDCDDISVDILRNVTIPLLQNFGISGVNIKVPYHHFMNNT